MSTKKTPDPEHVALGRATDLIDALNQEAPAGKVVYGVWQVLLIAKANDLDAAAERHRDAHSD